MTRQRLARVFWLGAAAILVVAALISLVAILGGGFSETDGRILATLGSLLYTGAAALAGLALAEREKARPLGLALLGLSAVTFVLLAAAIWGADGDTAWRLALSGALYLVAGLVCATGLLLTTRPSLQRLALVAGALTALAVSLTLVPIWRDEDPGSVGLTGLLADLRREFDGIKPVRIITVAYGADADLGVLRRIADVTGGASYQAPTASDVAPLLAKALADL